jgi:DHA2 family multidrug resistance protein-like MFS transporter
VTTTSAVTSARARRVALVVLCLCALTTGLDMTIVNLALPFISRELDASISELQWVIDAYNIVLAGLLVLGGGLADRYGRKIVFLSGYALFGLACLLAALSGSAEALIGSRALMGVGAAGVVAPALAIISMLYPPEERAPAIAAFAVFGAAGLAIGPVMGGLLLDHFWWGSIFLVNVPIVFAGVIVGIRVIPESRKPDARCLDVLGALLSVLGLGVFLFGVIEGPDRGWLAPEVVGGLVAGVALLIGFVFRELHTDAPLFDVRILIHRVVSAGSVTLFTAYVLFTGMLFLLPQWLQEVRHESIVTVGLLLVPFAVVFGLLSIRSTAIVARLGEREAISGGLLVCALGMALLGVFVHDDTVFSIVATVVLAAGLSELIAPPSTVVMNALPDEEAGDGSSLNMVSRFVGAAIGVAVIGSVFASIQSHRLDEGDSASVAFDAGARAGYWIAALFAFLAAVWAWRALRVREPSPRG